MPETLPGCRWVKPLNVAPGHWKKQLPGKVLKLAERGKLDDIRALLAEHPEFLNKRGPHGRTLLWSAVRHARTELVNWLIEQGADPNLTGSINSESFVQLSPLAACEFYGRLELRDALENHGAKDDLFRLTYRGISKSVIRALNRDSARLFEEDPEDEIYFSPLMTFAIVGGHVDLVQAFIERGFDVTIYSFQLLFVAAHFGDKAILESLLQHGATAETADASIWMATNDLAILQRLIDHGLSANQRPYSDLTPLLYVCRADKGTRLDKLKLVLELGGDVQATSKDGRSALHYAVMSGNIEACKLLLDAGIDPHQSSKKVPPAAVLAREKGYHEIAQLIEKQ